MDTTVATMRRLPARKKIAIYNLQHSSAIEYGLAMSLRLRGHDVVGILCDGLLPLCELNLGPNVRPPCRACEASLSRFEHAFGFAFERLTNYLSFEDRLHAERLVDKSPLHEWPTLAVHGIPVGRLARRELQRYYRGFVFDPPQDRAFRDWLISGVLMAWLAERWLDGTHPDIVGMCSGRTLATACLLTAARQRGISVVTWDGAASRGDTLVFSHNRSATEIPLDEAWSAASQRMLSAPELQTLHHYLRRWSRSDGTPFPYNPDPLEEPGAIRRSLRLRDAAPLVVAFTNTAWDIAVIDRDVGFESMFDWLFSLVEFAIEHPHFDVIIRAHPAEKSVPPDLRSRTPVAREIRIRFPDLPANLVLVEGDNHVSSYSLAAMATVNMVYASRIGLEIAMSGKRPWIAGAVTYRGKGFTRDLESKQHMLDLLSAPAFDDRLGGREVELAQRFAYLWFFRYEVQLPLLRPATKRFELGSFAQLGPGGDQTLERVCSAFVNGEEFLDISAVPRPRLASR